MTCKPFDVVAVPFPFTDRRTSKRRPALALSSEEFSAETGNTLLAMITSARNSSWPFDIPLDFASAGLRAPSVVRMKLFTLDNRLILRTVGTLGERDRSSVRSAIRRLIGV
jgi:mRNA-degrading endonuclease toxin of MazEF toxin-antitoxin module